MATNVPVTIWRKTDGNNDSESDGPNFIVDPDGNYLIDMDDNFVIDTGINMPRVPVTVWEEDNSI